jgi:hypothetical protein
MPAIRWHFALGYKIMQKQLLSWLGRQDSNLGMAESKSRCFALFINGHSEEIQKFDLLPIKRLAGISECRDARHALS